MNKMLLPGKAVISCVVGSRLHGTDNENSDYDTRYVVVDSTSNILKPEYSSDYKHLCEEGTDSNFWELTRFIQLALKGNQTTLEVLLAPGTDTWEGTKIRALFPHLLQRLPVYGSCRGFAWKQLKLMQNPKTSRRITSSAHYLRVLFNGIELLTTGTMTCRIVDTEIGEQVLAAKQGKISFDKVERLGAELEKRLGKAYQESILPEKANMEFIDETVRKANW